MAHDNSIAALLMNWEWCSACNGQGVKPRDLNPPWTEVETEPSWQELHYGLPQSELEKLNIVEPATHAGSCERSEQWKAIATQLS